MMRLRMQVFILLLISIVISGCSSTPVQPEMRAKNTVPLEPVEPLETDMSEKQEYSFALDVAEMEIKNKRYDHAYRLLNKLKKYHPEDPQVYRLFGSYYRQQQQFEMAYLSYKKVLDYSSNKSDEQEFARYALLSEHYQQADKIYQRWLENTNLSHEEVTALNNLGFSQLLQKNPDKARVFFEEALKRDPLNEKARNNLRLISNYQR